VDLEKSVRAIARIKDLRHAGLLYATGDGSLSHLFSNCCIIKLSNNYRGEDNMPRKARQQSKSGIYHIMIRGNERTNIFLDDEDRIKFINILGNKKKEKEYSIYAYCLMNNHVHLLIKEEQDDISRIMKKINTSYAYYFNKKYNRIGHVFQDRFKSESIEDDRYFLAAIRYIHNNPVQANIVTEAVQYHWSSYWSYLSKDKNNNKLIERNYVLQLFSQDEEKAIKMLKEFTNQPTEDNFLEYKEEKQNKELLDKKSAEKFIENYLKEKNLQLEGLKQRRNIESSRRAKV